MFAGLWLDNNSGTDTSRAYPHPPDAAVPTDMPYLLEIRIPDAFGLIIRVADVIPYMRRLAAELTYSAHDCGFLSKGQRQQ